MGGCGCGLGFERRRRDRGAGERGVERALARAQADRGEEEEGAEGTAEDDVGHWGIIGAAARGVPIEACGSQSVDVDGSALPLAMDGEPLVADVTNRRERLVDVDTYGRLQVRPALMQLLAG